MPAQQSFKNHARLRPEFHIGVFSLLLINAVWSIYRIVQEPGLATLVPFLLAVALMVMAVSLRVQALTVQDRVIRLEMRMRLQQLLPADLQAAVASLSPAQLVALRFASDGELPGLIREVLSGSLADQKAIKQRITDWQGDYLRA